MAFCLLQQTNKLHSVILVARVNESNDKLQLVKLHPICPPLPPPAQYQHMPVLARREILGKDFMYDLNVILSNPSLDEPELVIYIKQSETDKKKSRFYSVAMKKIGPCTYSCPFSMQNQDIAVKQSATFKLCIQDVNNRKITLGRVRAILPDSFRKVLTRKYFNEYPLYPNPIPADDINPRPRKKSKRTTHTDINEDNVPQAPYPQPEQEAILYTHLFTNSAAYNSGGFNPSLNGGTINLNRSSDDYNPNPHASDLTVNQHEEKQISHGQIAIDHIWDEGILELQVASLPQTEQGGISEPLNAVQNGDTHPPVGITDSTSSNNIRLNAPYNYADGDPTYDGNPLSVIDLRERDLDAIFSPPLAPTTTAVGQPEAKQTSQGQNEMLFDWSFFEDEELDLFFAQGTPNK